MTTEPATETRVKQEFRKFLSAIGYVGETAEEREKLVGPLLALIQEMKETARGRGMTEDQIATIYDAGDLIDLYRETIARRH